MNKKKILLGSAIGMGALFTGATLSVGKKIYDATFGAQPHLTSEEMESYYSQKEDKVLDKLNEYSHQKFMVENSKNNYLIETLHIKSNQEADDVMVLVHGIRRNYYDLLTVAFRYLDDGYNVVLYNQRHTGLTGGKEYTFGLYERLDLDEVVTIARRLYPNGLLGVHGFSMGAATAVMHTEINEKSNKVDFYVVDAPYHTMESSVELALHEKKPPLLPRSYVKWSGNVMLKLRSRVKYSDVAPLDAIAHASVPVLIIHGTEDKVTSPEGSQMLFEAIPHENKSLKYFEGCAHCVAHLNQEDEYFKTIYKFIDKNTKKNKSYQI